MIKLNVVCGDGLRQEFVSPNAIARISQTGASSQWHGIRSVVRTFDGKNLECAETASEVAAAVDSPIVAMYQAPSAIYRPAISKDGDQWCALYGDNLQDGVAGFGDTPELAMADFDKNWRKA